jgi:hypothetical protein
VPQLFVALRILALAAATVLLAAGGVLGYVAVVALRRSEGVFLPAGYVAIACLMAGLMLGRAVLRW